MDLTNDAFGHTSSKRVGGLLLLVTSCLGTLQCIEYRITDFTSLLIGLATIGAGLLGSTMVERKLK
jgi:hypothetical protein